MCRTIINVDLPMFNKLFLTRKVVSLHVSHLFTKSMISRYLWLPRSHRDIEAIPSDLRTGVDYNPSRKCATTEMQNSK